MGSNPAGPATLNVEVSSPPVFRKRIGEVGESVVYICSHDLWSTPDNPRITRGSVKCLNPPGASEFCRAELDCLSGTACSYARPIQDTPPMNASEFEQHRAEQEREDTEEGYLQLGVIGAVMGAMFASGSPVEEGDEDED